MTLLIFKILNYISRGYALTQRLQFRGLGPETLTEKPNRTARNIKTR